jgi:endonuclease VIII
MAEGHAVIRWARNLRALVGEPLREVRLPQRWHERVQSLPGQHITEVQTHGKVLLLHLSGGETILCHAMQYGSWQVGEPGMTLRKDPKYVRLRLVTDAHEAVFYHGPIIELLTPEELAKSERYTSLGPDVMAADFDRDEAWKRLQSLDNSMRPIGELVLNQRVIAGIGNIYKSEGLFLANIHPCRPAAELNRTEMDKFWDAVIPLMWEGTERYGRTLTLSAEMRELHPGVTRWVYARKGKPCLRCGTPIQKILQGATARSTYFCPICQPETSATKKGVPVGTPL